jgi:predicted P-loop ATPase
MTTVFDAARDSLALGIYPVPIKPGAKKPSCGDGWQDLRLTVDDLQSYFDNGQNIGWLLGIAPKFIADIDFDSPESLAVAPLIAGPKTQRIAGRKSSPHSHFFFELPSAPAPNAFKNPLSKKEDAKKMFVELRGTGQQTIVPPSIHISGESYEWSKRGEFGKTTYAELLRWASKIAAASLLVRYWPGRVSARLGLIGMLARAEWPEQETLEFVTAIIKCADQSDIKEVKGNVRNCYGRVVEDEEAYGITKLKETLGDNAKVIIRTITDWLGLKRAQPEGLIVTEKGAPRPLLANAITALRHPKWEGVLALNEFSLHIVTKRETVWGKPAGEKWTDVDDIRAANWLQHQYVCVNPQTTHDAVQTLAEENRFHPVRDYLKSLKWDGEKRIESWLIDYLGAADTKFIRAVGKRWLISGVARIFQPGCQADHTLLLEGPQGIKKSTALRVLAGPEWFTDHISDLDSKDSRMELHGKWIVELAELSAVRRSLAEKVKSFLTATSDHFRLPYGRSIVDVERQNIFAGSINDETPFTDETGNRRFWPVRCGIIFTGKLEEHRNQLWAEAVELYEDKENWWLDSNELNSLASEEQKQRYQTGVWDDIIVRWLEHCPDEITIADVLSDAIKKKLESWTHSDKMTIAKCLRSNGWNQSVVKDGRRKSVRVYRRPPGADDEAS